MNKLKSGLDRRSFLKSSGVAAGVAMLGGVVVDGPVTEAVPAVIPQEAAAGDKGSPTNLVELVNLFQGTDSTPAFSRGNTLPIAARPFGMAHWTLETRSNGTWMFAPGERRIQGFRSTHQLSPWLGDYGQATFLPFCGEIQPDGGSRASSYRPEKATLLPHSMRLRLLRYGIDVELIPTERCGLMTATYSKSGAPGWLVDIPWVDKDAPVKAGEVKTEEPTWAVDEQRHRVRFTSTANEGGVPAGFATYYVMQFAQAWKTTELKELKGRRVGMVTFEPGVKAVEVRVGTSFISFEQAQRNIDLELGTRTADAVKSEGAAVWNKHLGTIEVTGATDTQRKTLYSCLYRTLLFPRIWHEPDASGAMQHRSAYNGKVVPGVMYADHGYWDVYRAWYPMMTVLFPERLGEILQAWVNAYKEGGWLPQFPCPGYKACMTGSLIDSVFGDAAAKKIPGFDMETAYAGLKKHATEPGDAERGFGRRGIKEILQYGYAPVGMVDQSAAETVDAAYGDFCIAQVAKALGHEADYAMFMKRSENWKHLFDDKTGFIRGKKADGSWLAPFDPLTWGDPYVEGGAWQHRWDAPHDEVGLFALLGGKEKAVAILQTAVTMAPDFNVGVYGSEIHEMSEMAAVDFGQYDHGNQPSHHVLYLFAAAGRRDLTAHWTRRVMEELYSPAGFAGDEDTGSMAAWYILSAMGFYSLCPGKAEYMLGEALFPAMTVRLPQGKTLRIENAGAGGGKVAGSVSFNGKALSSTTIGHAELVAGGVLRFS